MRIYPPEGKDKRFSPLTLGRMGRQGCAVCAWLLIGFLTSANSQTDFTKADSGWVPLFNGEDFEGLYSRMYGGPVTDEPDDVFQVRTEQGTDDPMIHVSGGGGHLGTDEEFSHYRMRVDYRFGNNTGSNDNAGLMYHLTEDWPRMANNWPRSIECQMRKQETGDAFSIQDVTYEVPVRPGTRQYEPGSNTTTTSYSGNHRQVFSLSHAGQNPYDDREWNTMEIIVRGSDSAEHTVDGVSLLKLYNIRIPNPNGSGHVPWPSGKLAVQAEGAEIMYKNWEIMELPEDSPTDYLQRIILTSPSGGEEFVLPPPYPDPIEITWEHIGDFSEVDLELSTDDGETWMPIATTENDGSYEWLPMDSLLPIENAKIRVSADSWVMAGESDSSFSIRRSVRVGDGRQGFQGNLSFSIQGQGVIFHGRGDFNSIEIYDLSGKLYWSASVNSRTVTWDGRQEGGRKAPSGLYLARFRGNTARQVPFVLR